MCSGTAERPLTPAIRLTGRQKLVLSLAKAGYGPSRIAELLGITRESASRLLARARGSRGRMQLWMEQELEAGATG